MEFLTKEEYFKKANEFKYWRKSRNERWKYMSVVLDELKKHNPNSILEAGTNALPLSKDSYILSLREYELVNKNGIIHNLDDFPYPFEDKQFDFFVALQVWEHIKEKQKAFQEICRISENVILSFPYKWGKSHKDHGNIDDETIRKWTNNLEPTYTKLVAKRKIYFWINISKIST